MIELAHDHMHHALPLAEAAGSGLAALVAALFGAGLAGGFTHCAGMCGPFVLAQVSASLERVQAERMSELTRLAGAALGPYHAGRLTTYMGLGALAGGLVGRIEEAPGLGWLAAGLLGVASLMFLIQAGARIAGATGGPTPASGEVPRPGARQWSGLLARTGDALARIARPLMAAGGGAAGAARRYGLGIVLGFLPCGLLYGALAAAAGAGSALTGAIAMGAFTLGTVPGLVGIGWAGHLALRRRVALVRWAATALFLVNAATLAYLAVRAMP